MLFFVLKYVSYLCDGLHIHLHEAFPHLCEMIDFLGAGTNSGYLG